MTCSKLYIRWGTNWEQDFLHRRNKDFCQEVITFGPENKLLDCTTAEISVRDFVILKHNFPPSTSGIGQKSLLDWALKYRRHGEKGWRRNDLNQKGLNYMQWRGTWATFKVSIFFPGCVGVTPLCILKNDHLQNDFRYINGLTSNLFLLVRYVTSHPEYKNGNTLFAFDKWTKMEIKVFLYRLSKEFTILTETGIGTFWYSERSLLSRELFVIIDKHTNFLIRSKALSYALIVFGGVLFFFLMKRFCLVFSKIL